MFLKGCEKYGLKRHDLFQVNDLYERKNLYTVSEIDLIIHILENKQLKKIPVNETVKCLNVFLKSIVIPEQCLDFESHANSFFLMSPDLLGFMH